MKKVLLQKKLLPLAISAAILPGTAMAELTVDAYGSLRVQAESVNTDANVANDSYTGIRDAYSRFGASASYPLAGGTTLGAKIEIPFNVQQMTAEDPSYFEGFYKDNNDPRVYKLTASGDWGSVAIGKQWLAYYNNVAYPVDYFSTYYSGFATHATFRREAVTYTTPSISGFKATASKVDMTDGDDDYLESAQYALSYNANGFAAALGYQDEYGTNDTTIIGASASYTTGPWRFAGKVETAEDNTNKNEATIYNIYGSYTMGKYTFKATYADGDSDNVVGAAFFQGDTIHLGADYQYTKNLKVFVEYFQEEKAYAILEEDTEAWDVLGGYGTDVNGQAIAIGARYDF